MSIAKQFNEFASSSPEIFFASFEARFEGMTKIIYNEYLEWQNGGGHQRELTFRDIEPDILVWKIGEESFAQKVDKFAPFSREQYKRGLTAIYSFMEDRPQYYRFRHMDGMFNPLRLLLYKFL